MTIVVKQDGSIVLPRQLRQSLGFDVGTELIARVEGEKLVLQTRAAALDSLRSIFDHIPPEVSLVDELIAERRREAAREETELG
jgi:bifunctional DNA-binding transcriptional regulator/antitoxin component of YhaV-PrlF toxin-antitoxin module